VVTINLAYVPAFATALGQRAKTDPIDASVIARFLAATRSQPRSLPEEASQMLADLVIRRRQIIQMIVAERQREKRALARTRRSIGRLIEALQKEFGEIDTRSGFAPVAGEGRPARLGSGHRLEACQDDRGRAPRTRHP
jgi:transposase